MRWVRQFYLLIIPLTIGLMLLHNVGDWVRKTGAPAPPTAPGRSALRERPPRNPHVPLRALPARRAGALLHDAGLDRLRAEVSGPVVGQPLLLWRRLACAAWCTASRRVSSWRSRVVHVVSLIASRRLREHWKEMLPKLQRRAARRWHNFAYNIGLRNRNAVPFRAQLHREGRILGRGLGRRRDGAARALCCGPTTWCCRCCPSLARRGHLRALLRSAAGHAGHRGMALLFA